MPGTDLSSSMVMCEDKEGELTHNIADLYCGGGGSGHGILKAFDSYGRVVKSAPRVHGTFINHSEHAIETHLANHPTHRHKRDDLFRVNPLELFPDGTDLPFLWSSPSCTSFSIARGSVPVTDQERSHAHCIVKWVRHKRPDVVFVENVKEFLSWGSLRQRRDKVTGSRIWCRLKDGKPTREYVAPAPVAQRKGEHAAAYRRRLEAEHDLAAVLEPDKRYSGQYFKAWFRKLASLGYRIEYRILKSSDYGGATRRQRLFVYAVRVGSGKRIVWPAPTHGAPDSKGRPPRGRKIWRTVADIIDWEDKGTSIFTRPKPLAPKTMWRIAVGFCKYGLVPYMVPKDRGWDGLNVCGVDEPASTITTTHRGEGLARPYVVQYQGQSTAHDIAGPLSTIQTQRKHYLVNPAMIKLRGRCNATPVNAPLDTITGGGLHHAIMTAFMIAAQTNAESAPDAIKRSPLYRALQDGGGEFQEVDAFLAHTAHQDTSARAAASRVAAITDVLPTVTGNRGDLALVRPWIYTYYSSGSPGDFVTNPSPTVTAKARLGICYPAVEFDGKFYVIDILFRMLTPRELARAMGFPETYKFPGTKTQQVRAIGNSVSCEVAEALTLAYLFQDENITNYQHNDS